MTIVPGVSLGRYQILGPIGSGGVATVFRAYQPGIDRVVALKVISPPFADDPRIAERFDAEARAVAMLRHPNIVQVFDVGTDDGHYFMAMELIEGETLKAHLARLAAHGRRMEANRAAAIVGQVAAALAHAHEKGVIHGDVKPANVLIARDGTAVLTDFGVAALLETSPFAQAGAGIGTPEYMSPEQARGSPIDARSDQYSLGVIAYGLLTGRMPFAGDTPVAVALAHTFRPLPLPSTVEPRIGTPAERVLMRALARDPSVRYQRTTDFADALARAVRSEPGLRVIPVAASGVIGTAPGRSRRTLLALAMGGVIAFAAGALTATIIQRAPQPIVAPADPAVVAPPAPTAGATAPPRQVAAVPTSAPSRAPEPTPMSRVSPPARGALLFAAKLQGGDELRRVRTFAGKPGDAVIEAHAGEIELTVRRSGAGAIGDLPVAASTRYYGEFALRVAPGSDLLVSWGLRREGASAYLVHLDAGAGTVTLAYSGAKALEALAPSVAVPALRTGGVVEIAFLVDDGELAMYLGGVEVARAHDERLRAASVPDLFVGGDGGTGSARLLAARIYALP